MKLPKGSVIAGRVLDEDAEPVPGATVRAFRFEYQQGERTLAPVGSDQSDDRGVYRIYGLMPGEHVVSAAIQGSPGRLMAQGRPGGPLGGPRGAGFPARGPDAEDTSALAPTYYPSAIDVDEAGRPHRACPGAARRRHLASNGGHEPHQRDAGWILGRVRASKRIAAAGWHRAPGSRSPARLGDPRGLRRRVHTQRRSAGPLYARCACHDFGRFGFLFGTQPLIVSGQNIPDVSVLMSPGVRSRASSSSKAAERRPHLSAGARAAAIAGADAAA